MVERVPLYISDNLAALKRLIRDETINGLKRIDRLPGIAHRMFLELLQIQNDQERSYIIALRYIKVMDHLLKLAGNRRYLEICYGGEYRKVQSLIVDLEADLEARYEDLARRKRNQERMNQPGQAQLYGQELFARKFPILDNLFISSTDLYNALRNKWNILIVDIRLTKDYTESKVAIDEQHMINIPGDILVPGLSANALADHLEEPTRAIWNRRDNFEIMVLLDWNTDHFNYQGSKLERLRSCIVEWDLNRKYNHDPIILDGGFKEFLERYPSEVTNGHVFLYKTNSEVDELLMIDDISYPELGSVTNTEINFEDKSKVEDENKNDSTQEENEENSYTFQKNYSEEVGSSMFDTCDINKSHIDEDDSSDSSESTTSEEYRDTIRIPALDRTLKPIQEVMRGYTGISNMLNNCYMSCMLQCLKSLPQFKTMFVTTNNYYKHISKEKPSIVTQFATVMRNLWSGTQNCYEIVYPEQFFERVYEINPLYRRGNHEDTFEFFIFLFNLLSEDCSYDIPRLKTMTEREKSLYIQLQGRSSRFVDLFYYQLRNDKMCWRCRKPSLVFDSDNTLMLPLVENKERVSLEELIAEYLKESLVPECSCSECKYSSTIINRKRIVLDPEILVIMLKRYAANSDGTFRKIESDVSFPSVQLSFGRSLYRLYAVPQHIGSVSVGHYFASVLVDQSRGTWVKFNDEQVVEYECPIQDVPDIESSCVGFFYVRQSDDAVTLK